MFKKVTDIQIKSFFYLWFKDHYLHTVVKNNLVHRSFTKIYVQM